MCATQPLEMHTKIASTTKILTWKFNAIANRWIWGIILMKMSIKNLATQLLIKIIIIIMCQLNQQIKIYVREYMCWFVNMCIVWQLWSTSQSKNHFNMPLPDLWHASKSYDSNLDVLRRLALKPSSTLLSTIPQSEAQCWLIPNFRLSEGC